MAKDYSKWDQMYNQDQIQKEINEAKERNFKEVPLGTYDVKVEKLELVSTKEKGLPMLSCWFSITNGEYKGQKIFMNQMLNTGLGIHLANEFLKSLDSGLEIEFISYSDYDELLLDVHEAIDGQLEYSLEYGKTAKGYNTYKIKEIFEVA